MMAIEGELCQIFLCCYICVARGIVKKEYLPIILVQFFLFLHKKHMLWLHIRSTSARHF